MHKMQELLGRVSLDELAAFVAVVESHSFTDAAKVIGRDATIVSKRVAQLEARLGVRLLSRTTRRVAVTEVGTLYYQRVRALLDELDSAGQDASNFAATPQGLLRVSLPITFGRRWVVPMLASFMGQYPNIKVDARFADRIVDVVSEGFDVAIRVGALRDSSLVARRIAPFSNYLYASPAYLERNGVPATPEDLLTHACLGFISHASWPDWLLRAKGQQRTIRPSGPLNTDNSEALLQAAIDGAGVILTPDWLAKAAVAAGQLVQVLPAWQGAQDGGVYALMPPGRLIPTKTRVFVDAVSSAIQNDWAT